MNDDKFKLLIEFIFENAFRKGYKKGLRKGKSIGSHQAYNKFVKHGRWHEFKNSNPIRVACSECGHPVNWFWDNWRKCKYCPSCGAKMDEEDNQ